MVTAINTSLSILEQAKAEVRKELADKALEKMKKIVRDHAAALAVVKGLEMQIADLEAQIADGTL